MVLCIRRSRYVQMKRLSTAEPSDGIVSVKLQQLELSWERKLSSSKIRRGGTWKCTSKRLTAGQVRLRR